MSKNIKLYILAIFLLNSIFIFSERIINIEDTDYKNSLVYAKGENVSFNFLWRWKIKRWNYV